MERKYIAAIALVLMTGIFITFLASGSIISQIVVPNAGIVRRIVTAASGSPSDIQAAVNQVVGAGGGTVNVPAGNFSFEPVVGSNTVGVSCIVPAGGISIVGAGPNQTRLQMPVGDSNSNSDMFYFNGESGGKLKISGISFEGRPNWQTSPVGDQGVVIESCQDFRVYNCSFYYFGGCAVEVSDVEVEYGISGGNINLVSQGVVDHCDFHYIYKPACTNAGRGYGYGVSVKRGYHYLWTYNIYPSDPWVMFGKYYKNTYIEDCYFYSTRHATQAVWAGAYVLRYSVVQDIGLYEVSNTGHPVRENTFGMLTCEIYNVTIKRSLNLGHQFEGPLVEGGSALLFNNTLQNLDVAFELGSAETSNGTPYSPLGFTKEVYIWGNTVTNCNQFLNSHSNAPDGQPAPVENVQYFLRAPNASMNYVPYSYPHPLTLG